jgi:hypothetical protein
VEVSLKYNLRRRFWVEAALASAAGILCLITPIWPDWIEVISGWDPDQHDGSAEWMIALGLLFVAAAIAAVAAVEWRQAAVEKSKGEAGRPA